jgi:hypothetical protein
MTDSSPAIKTDSTPQVPVPESKPGIFWPWLMVGVVLIVSWVLHVVMDPASECLEQLNIFIGQITQCFPASLHGIVGEILSWMVAFGIKTPYGSVAWAIFSFTFFYAVVRPLLASFLGALFGHLLLLVTGGTTSGWRTTWRAFAFNRIGVEAVSVVAFVLVGYSSLDPKLKFLILLFLIPAIRLIGMGVLLSQIVKGQGIGIYRTLFVIGPLFVFFTIASIIFSFPSVLWISLWCFVKVH